MPISRYGYDTGGAIGPAFRRSQFVRSAFQFAGIAAFLLCFSMEGLAPNIGPADPAPVAVEPAGPDPINDPPRALDFSDLRTPRLRAQAAIIYNPDTHEVLWESEGHTQRPIASITKVMTALVFLEQNPDLSRDVVISRRDARRASTTYLRRGERIQLGDLLHLALVASDNAAARVLARVSPWGTDGFVKQMNRKADELGLHSTMFADPSGLNKNNLSTPYDLSRLMLHATEQTQIATIMRKQSHQMRTNRRRLTVRNTNRLLQGRLNVIGGKTGYIDASGYCLAAVVNVPDVGPLSVVVLGARSNSGRFSEVRRLADWVSADGRSLIASDAVLVN
jgi:D-alanyl-D-alanine endopeptidase (penicillin-binding protein 7)